jgi:hypothetical protein
MGVPVALPLRYASQPLSTTLLARFLAVAGVVAVQKVCI